MTDIEIKDQFNRFLVDNFMLARSVDIVATPSFLEAGIIDSTGVLELVQFIEETFALSVKDEEMMPDNLDSLANLVRFVQTKTAQV
jgi:acyl carrier protein